jgi:hypothetical protein
MFSILWVCVCSLSYAACNACAPYCHLWSARLYKYFTTLSHKLQVFRKMLFNTKCILIFSTNFVWNITHSKKNWARYDHKCVSVFMKRAVIFPHYLINCRNFEKILFKIKCILISLQILSETSLFLRRTERDMITNACRSSCEVPLFFHIIS